MSVTERPNYEALYHQLVRLREEMPHVAQLSKPEATRWLGRALALVEAAGCMAELVTLRVQVRNLSVPATLYLYEGEAARAIPIAIDTAIAKVELKLPAGMQGAFIPAGGLFDAFQVVAKAVETAVSDVFFIDPYADEVLIRDFVTLVPEHVQVPVMDDAFKPQPSLEPAAKRWNAQYPTRPLQVRRAPARALHDRLIVIDEKVAWAAGQTFKDFVKRSPSYLQRVAPEAGALKIAAYKAIWDSATPLA